MSDLALQRRGNHTRALKGSRSALQVDGNRMLLVADGFHGGEVVSMLRRYEFAFEDDSFDVEPVHTMEECVQALARSRFDLVLLDDSLAIQDGLALLRDLTSDDDSPPVIVITGEDEERLALEAKNCGAYGSIPKDSTDYLILGRALH